MIGGGAQCLPFHRTQDSRQLLIKPLISIPQHSLLGMQKELHAMILQVGRLIMSELQALENRHQQEAEEDEDHRERQRQASIYDGRAMARQSSVVRYRARQLLNIMVRWVEHVKRHTRVFVP